MADDDINDGAEDFGTVADQLSAGVLKNLPLDKIRDMMVGAAVQSHHGQATSVMDLCVELLFKFGVMLEKLEEPAMPLIAGFIAPIVAGLFGSEIDASAFASRANRAGRGGAAGAIVDGFMSSLVGEGTSDPGPSDAGAKRIATAAVHATLEGQLQALVTSILSDFAPAGFGHFDELVNLPEDIIRTLGISRLVRRAFSPLVDATAATPMKWKVAQDYRQTLLAEGDITKAFLRGDYTAEEAADELSRLGYSDKRQDILLKNVTKFLSADDALVLVRHGAGDRDFALQNLIMGGYDQVGAENALLVAETKRLEGIQDDSVAAIKAAYVDRRISDSDLASYMPAIYADETERDAHIVAFRTIRDLNTKVLSSSQVEACVKAGVLNIGDYRAALLREGYSDNDELALELLLEVTLKKDADVAALRTQKLADAAAAATAKAAADATKQAAVDAQRALAQLGPLSQIRRAVVTGLIPVDRYEAILDPQYDADTVQTLVALVEQDRAAYVANQQKADDATKAAALKHIGVGALQTAVLDNVLTIDEFKQSLLSQGMVPGDVDILAATLQARQTDLQTAAATRAAAAAKAATKSISLSDFEQLVRLGHKSIADYTAFLTSLDYDAGSVAGMVDLLNTKIATDQTAAATRAAVAAASAEKGLSLEQARRAVILDEEPIAWFQQWLIDNKYTVDAQGVLLAELRDDVSAADAARAKREAAAAKPVETGAPLSTVERAARLGVVTPDVYQQRLKAAGYSDDDIAIEMDLLAVEIADAQAAAAKAAAAEAKSTDAGLSLGQLATAVKLGEASLTDYQARAAQFGYSTDDVSTLVAVLADQVETIQAAQARHDTIDGQLTARSLSLSELDAAVKAGQLTIDAYTARIIALGFGDDDAQLLTTLLQLKLDAAAAKANP